MYSAAAVRGRRINNAKARAESAPESRRLSRLAIKQASQAGKPWLAGLKLFTPKAGLLGLTGQTVGLLGLLKGLFNFI
jgi:hypothetical protein